MTKANKERILEINQEMKELAEDKHPDIECSPSDADDLLCELLSILGYQDIVDNFEKLDKWYA